METLAAVKHALWQTINDNLQSSSMNRNQPTVNTMTMNPLFMIVILFEWEVYRYIKAQVAKVDWKILIECAMILIN